MNPFVGLFFDLVILAALGVTVFYCLRLSKQFAQMRADRAAIESLIQGLNHLYQRTLDFGFVYPPVIQGPVASMAIGTLEMHAIDLTSAFGAIGNGGVLVPRTTILEVKDTCPGQGEPDRYDEMRAVLTERFASRTQAEWVEIFEGTDACVAGIIPVSEAFEHPHLVARETFVEKDGMVQPQPAPRFSRTAATLGLPPSREAGQHTREALTAWGVPDVDGLIERGVAVQV